MKNIVYIVGGFGTRAGLDILNKLITNYENLHPIKTDSDYINVNFLSSTVSINHMTYTDTLCSFQHIMDHLLHFQTLHKYKNIFVVIGCNTMHLCLENYNFSIPKNILIYKIPEYVNTYISSIYKNETIYLWSTHETYKNKLYHTYVSYPIEEYFEYDRLDNIIIDIKKNKSICDNTLTHLFKHIKSNSFIILGCTELPLIKEQIINVIKNRIHKSITVLDPNDIITQYIIHDYRRLL